MIFCIGSLYSCTNPDEQATPIFSRAEKNFQKGNYALAKLQIDSIRTLYPKAFQTRRAAVALMQEIELSEQDQNLSYLDSLEKATLPIAEELTTQFILEKNEEYQETGNYFHPSQVNYSIATSHLKAQVSEEGELLLTSVYSGNTPIDHKSIRLSKGNQIAESTIATDVYTTQLNGKHIEMADYRATDNAALIQLLTDTTDEKTPIQFTFLGKKAISIPLKQADIQAIRSLKQLSNVLSTLRELRKHREEALLKIRFIERKKAEFTQVKANN